ncbi:response regulator [Pannonibacter tanglangensis]|nr:response regulator [Pannonibacter sp. XCT-34]
MSDQGTPDTKMPFLPQGFQTRVMITLILASVLPLALGGWVFFALVNRNITEETYRQVAFARDAKSSEVLQYLTFARREAESIGQSANVRYAVGDFYGFSFAMGQMAATETQAGARLRLLFGVEPGGSTIIPPPAPVGEDILLREALEYANAHRRFHPSFADFIAASEYDNLYLVNTRGRVVYSVAKDAYLGHDLNDMTGPLAALYAKLRVNPQSQALLFSDFVHDPVSGQFVAYLGMNVRLYTTSNATIFFRLPAEGLGRLMQASNVMTLISSRGEVIAATRGAGISTASPAAVPAQMRAPQGIETLTEGLIGVPTLSAWKRLTDPAPGWLVVAESEQARAFATSRRLRDALLLIGIAAIAALVPAALALSRSMTGPIRRLARSATMVANGALDEELPEYDRPLEYADLSRAVTQMRRSLRDQVEVISQKNAELEQHLRQIEEKNAELEEADRMKDRFLAATSHELRTPLNGIIGISETLGAGAMGEFAPAQKSQLHLIALSARRLSRLVDDLLDIYRIREGRMRLDLQPLDVAQSLRNVLQLARPMLTGEPVTLRVDVDGEVPAVHADPVRFEQILFNLITNAVKYGGEGRIEISARRSDGPRGPRVAIAIRDFGPGISPDSLERIFHPLEQITGSGSRAAMQEGTGLGLTIARNLAVLMSGTIEVESTLGEGSTFTVSLPASDQPALPVNRSELHEVLAGPDAVASRPLAEGDSAAPSILLVDDEPINLQVLRNVLLPRGYRVIDCDNGPDALRLVEEYHPDLVVLDVMMSGMSGLDVARHLRRRYSLLDLPIILLTARGRTRDMIAGFEVGANDYVVKPFVKDELVSRIATLLEASRAKRRAEENSELKQEIERRIQVEDALRLSQRRMGQLLEALEDGLVCANPKGVVTFANPAAERWLGEAPVSGQTTLSDLLPDVALAALSGLTGDDDTRRVEAEIDGRRLVLNAFALLPDAGGGIALLLSEAGREAPGLVTSVRDAVDSSLPALASPVADDVDVVSADPYRAQIVAVMGEVLALWKQLTGKGKVDFAEASGIWRVSLDKSSLQTRTLDKYLMLETLPVNPRWRDVLRSGDYLLEQAARPDALDTPAIREARERLARDLALLRRLLPAGA